MMRSQRATATLLSLLQTPRVQTAALLSLMSLATGMVPGLRVLIFQ